MNQDIQTILLSEERLKEIVADLGRRISEDYKDKNLLMVSVLKGSVVFMADLMRAITIPCRIDFMSVSSYGSGVKTSGVVKIVKDLDCSVKGVPILLVEDIVDTGRTLKEVTRLLKNKGASDVKVVSLLDKPDRRVVDITADYVGFEIPNEFVVGFGLDYDQHYRNLPYIGVLKPEVYK